MYMTICVHVRSWSTAPLISGFKASKQKQSYAYFQHPLRLEPELDFWLWDNGAAIKEADAKLRARTSMVRFGMISIGRRGVQAPKHQISLIAISQSLSS